MSLTVEDYWSALDAYLERVQRLGDELLSVLVYGSLIEGGLRPGRSDIDGDLILHERVFADKERFINALEIMTDATEQLVLAGLPLQAFSYFSLAELSEMLADFMPLFADPGNSRVIFGEDVRAHIATTSVNRLAARAAFFEGLQVTYPLAAYLRKQELTPEDCREIIDYLLAVRRYPAKLACTTLDIWVHYPDAVQELETVFPEIDTSVLKRIDRLKESPESEVGAEELLEIIEELLIFVEVLHDKLLAELKLRLEASGASDYTNLLLK